MKSVLFVFLGGGTGAVMRYLLSMIPTSRGTAGLLSLPLGTLIANWLGCLLLGFFTGYMPLSSSVKTGITTGLMGGLTTFSTFSSENAKFLMNGDLGRASIHFILHNGIGILLVIVGLSFGSNLGNKGTH